MSEKPYVVFFGFRLSELRQRLRITTTDMHVVGIDVVMEAPGQMKLSVENGGPAASSLRADKTYTLKLFEEGDT